MQCPLVLRRAQQRIIQPSHQAPRRRHTLLMRVHPRLCQRTRRAFLHHRRGIVPKPVQHERDGLVGAHQRQPVHGRCPHFYLRVRQIRANDLSPYASDRRPGSQERPASTRPTRAGSDCRPPVPQTSILRRPPSHHPAPIPPARPPAGHAGPEGSAPSRSTAPISECDASCPSNSAPAESTWSAAPVSPAAALPNNCSASPCKAGSNDEREITRAGPRLDCPVEGCRYKKFSPRITNPTAAPNATTMLLAAALGGRRAPPETCGPIMPFCSGVSEVAEGSGVEAFSISARVRITSSSAGLKSSPDELHPCGRHGSKPIPQKVRTARKLSQVTGVRKVGYAECRRAGRRCCVRDSTPCGLSAAAGKEVLSSAVSLFIRGGFRSHRQKTQRVDCV